MRKDHLLDKIRSVQLSTLMLALHLDVFPNDKRAKDEFEKASDELDHLFVEYEKAFGPLTNFGSSYIEDPEIWISDPWPWDNSK